MGKEVPLNGLLQAVWRPGFSARSFFALISRPARGLPLSGSECGQPIHIPIPFWRLLLLLLCAGSSLSMASHECKNSALQSRARAGKISDGRKKFLGSASLHRSAFLTCPDRAAGKVHGTQ